MSIDPYDKNDESDIDVLDEKPSLWLIYRLKDFGSLQNGISKGKEYFGFGFPFVSYGNVYNDTITPSSITGSANSSKEEQKQYSVNEGDVFFTRTSETIDEIGISATSLQTIPNAIFSGFVIRLRPRKNKIYKGFSRYYFQSNYSRSFLSKQISLVTRASLSQNVLNNLPVLLPPKVEQVAIANYLDRKTSAIDQKIALLVKKISTYKELRKTIINETVCRGLNKTTKLKDSGIDWIGKIPEHWEVKRLKDSFNIFTGNSVSDKSLFEEPKNSRPYIATKDIDFETGGIDYVNGIYIPLNEKGFKVAKSNSTLICVEGANAGKKIGFTDKDVCFVNKLCSIKSFGGESVDRYFYYFSRSNLFGYQFFAKMNGLIGGVSISLIKYFDLLLPPQAEQIEITQYLDQKTAKIDQIVANITAQVVSLKELRKTLINDVVTGKVKVTD